MTVSGILFSAKIAPKNFKENNPSHLRHIAMPKRSSPRKMNRRNRRRIYCSKCGSSYSYSGSKTHVCMGDSNDEINNPDHDEMDSPPAQPFSIKRRYFTWRWTRNRGTDKLPWFRREHRRNRHRSDTHSGWIAFMCKKTWNERHVFLVRLLPVDVEFSLCYRKLKKELRTWYFQDINRVVKFPVNERKRTVQPRFPCAGKCDTNGIFSLC